MRREPITKVTLSDGRVRYRIRVDAGTRPDGSRIQAAGTYDTLREARQAIAKIRTEAEAGAYVGRSSITLAQHYKTWLAGKRKLRESTRQHYLDVAVPLMNAYGNLPIQAITKAHLDALVETMLTSGGRHGTGRSPSFVKAMLTALSQALDLAVAERRVHSNVARLVERPPMPLPEPLTWTSQQAAAFLEIAAQHPWDALWRLSMAGMRRGEVLGLTWSRVDLDACEITVDATRVAIRGTVAPSLPKTRRGWRTLPIWADLHASLKALRARQAAERLSQPLRPQNDLLAVHTDGRPILPRHYADTFKKLAGQAGLPIIPLKNARHTSVTVMREAGVPDFVVAAWHGHDETVMRAVYTDAQDPAMTRAADAIQQAMKRG